MSKKKLNIAVFHLGFFYSGGGERLVFEQARRLKKRGHRVQVFASFVDRKLSYPKEFSDLEVKQILPSLPNLFPSKVFFQILLTCIFFPLISYKFKSFDVIFAANQPSLWFAYCLKKIYKKPYVSYIVQPTRLIYPREIDKEFGVRIAGDRVFSKALITLLKPFIGLIDKASVEKSDKLLVIGNYTKARLSKYYESSKIVCYPGVDISPKLRLNRNRNKGVLKINGLNIEKPYILLTNRHFPQKRFDYAIRTVRKLRDKGCEARLVITGKMTGYTNNLMRLVKELKLEKEVVFTGFVGEKDLKKLYTHTVVYIYTSPDEDFGLGILEAMSAGTPVVAWNYGGPKEMVVNRKTGFLARPYNTSDFSEKIEKIINNKKIAVKFGENGWLRAKKIFSWEKHIDTIEKSLFAVIRNRK